MSLLAVESLPLWTEDGLDEKGSTGKKSSSLSGRKAQPLRDCYGKSIGGASELSSAFQKTETSLLQHGMTTSLLEVQLGQATQLYHQQQPLAAQRYAQFDQSLKANIGERALRGFNGAMDNLFEGIGTLASIPLDATVGKFCRTEVGGRVCGALAQGAVTALGSLGAIASPVADSVMTRLREVQPTADRDRALHAVADWSNIPPGVIREATTNIVTLADLGTLAGPIIVRAAKAAPSCLYKTLTRKSGPRGPSLVHPSAERVLSGEMPLLPVPKALPQIVKSEEIFEMKKLYFSSIDISLFDNRVAVGYLRGIENLRKEKRGYALKTVEKMKTWARENGATHFIMEAEFPENREFLRFFQKQPKYKYLGTELKNHLGQGSDDPLYIMHRFGIPLD